MKNIKYDTAEKWLVLLPYSEIVALTAGGRHQLPSTKEGDVGRETGWMDGNQYYY